MLKLVDNISLNGIGNDEVVLECSMELQENVLKLYPVRRRVDKTYPNAISTISSTIHNLLDHIEIEDLIFMLERGR